MNISKNTILALLVFALTGCMSGKTVYFVPTNEPANEQAGVVYPFTCGETTIQPSSIQISGASVHHYIIPLAISLPETETENDLEFEITIFSKGKEPESITEKDFSITLNNEIKHFTAYRNEVTFTNYIRSSDTYVKTSKFYISQKRDMTESFKVTFNKEKYGCQLPSIIYKKQTDKNISTLVNM